MASVLPRLTHIWKSVHDLGQGVTEAHLLPENDWKKVNQRIATSSGDEIKKAAGGKVSQLVQSDSNQDVVLSQQFPVKKESERLAKTGLSFFHVDGTNSDSSFCNTLLVLIQPPRLLGDFESDQQLSRICIEVSTCIRPR
jgi:hypothetical protein